MIGEEDVVNFRDLYNFLRKEIATKMIVEEKQLEMALVPLGMGVLLLYHFWLLFTIRYNPRKTVIGLNAESRHKWVFCLMADPLKNGVLAIQTLRNNIMASTLLATTAITLCSLISVYVSNKSSSVLEYGNKTSMSSVKFFAILVCFLVAFLCNLQSIRYYAHASFLVTVPTYRDKKVAIEYVATNLNRGGFFWSLGLRAFYLSFPLYLWVFGAVPMFLCCCVMSVVLYFLDTTSSFTRDMYDDDSISADSEDVESAVQQI